MTDTSGLVIERTREETQTENGPVAHIVRETGDKTAAAMVTEARVFGLPLEALCGHRWVPSRDPRRLPVCPTCKDIYETHRVFTEGLNETPAG